MKKREYISERDTQTQGGIDQALGIGVKGNCIAYSSIQAHSVHPKSNSVAESGFNLCILM